MTEEEIEEMRRDPVRFVEIVLGVTLDPYQVMLLQRTHRVPVSCPTCKGTGKATGILPRPWGCLQCRGSGIAWQVAAS